MNNQFSFLVTIFLLAAFISGCAGQPIGKPELLLNGAGQSPDTQLQADATGEPQVAPDGVSTDTTPGASESGRPEVDTMPSGGGESLPGQPVANWKAYTDGKYGFSLSYPDIYTILPEVELLDTISPDLIDRLRFMDSQMAQSDTAQLELPKFSVEIYRNPSSQSIPEWLGKNMPVNGSLDDAMLGGISCKKLTTYALMAPNEFHFCVYQNNVYKIVAVGEYSGKMLESFTFGK